MGLSFGVITVTKRNTSRGQKRAAIGLTILERGWFHFWEFPFEVEDQINLHQGVGSSQEE
jgi:hypothetical protein